MSLRNLNNSLSFVGVIKEIVQAIFWGTVTAFTVIVLLLLFRALLSAESVSAAANVLNPAVCLGGWKNSSLASGQTSLPVDSVPSSFDDSNSAYLAPHSASQIFCAGFSPEVREAPPHAVFLSFNWALIYPTSLNVEPLSASTTSDSSLVGTTFDQPSTTVETVIPALQDSADETESSSIDTPQISPTNIEGASSDEFESDIPIEPANAPAPVIKDGSSGELETAPVVIPPATDVPQLESFIYRSVYSFFNFPIAHAQEISNTAGILKVSYTYDGSEWFEAGEVTQDNWRHFSISLPNISWEQLQQLQVKIETLPLLDNRPSIYLDSVLLQVQDSPTFTENALDQLSAVGSLASTAFDEVNSFAEAVLTIFSPPEREDSAPALNARPSEVAPAPIPQRMEVLTFKVVGAPIATQRVLPWYEDEIKEIVGKQSGFLQPPDVSVSEDGLSITVKGSCSKDYFVVMTFRNPDDYKDKPQTFASNFADKCKGGKFTYDLNMLPLDTREGTYYLLTADQEKTGPWVISSAMLPISLGRKELEKVADEL